MLEANKRLSVSVLVWFLAFALHNTEEAWLKLPSWMAVNAEALPLDGSIIFSFVVVLLSAVALLASVTYLKTRKKWAKRLLVIFILGTLINTFVHAGVSIWAGSYSPGLATSLLLILPTSIWSLWEIKKENKAIALRQPSVANVICKIDAPRF